MSSRAKSFRVDRFELIQVTRPISEVPNGSRFRSMFKVNMGVGVGLDQHHNTTEGIDMFAIVNAALRRSLYGFFPCLKRVIVVDRIEEVVRLQHEDNGSITFGGKVMLSFTDGKKVWKSEKTSENLPSAILDALCEGFQAALSSL